jgi:hypothetical protein
MRLARPLKGAIPKRETEVYLFPLIQREGKKYR